ncbi:hypothetical protein CBM2623_U20027 [Cupriavidus taiwanensis]|nr:hypothetical protein CBM2623_U20027 [Cupriavidus taiwanensis]
MGRSTAADGHGMRPGSVWQASVQCQHILAGYLSRGQPRQRFTGTGEGQGAGDLRLERTLLIQPEDFLLHGQHLFRLAIAIVAPLQAADGDVLDQQIIGLDLWNAACREADDHGAPAPGDRTQRGIEDIAAEHVEHHIGAVARGGIAHLVAQRFAQVGGGKIDYRVSAQLPCRLRVFGAADAGERDATQTLDDLDRRRADAAGSAGDKHGFAGTESATLHHGEVGGLIDQAHGGRVFERHGIRDTEARIGRHADELGERAVFQLRHYAVAWLDVGDIGPDRAYHPGGILARCERALRQDLIFALHHQHVGIIDRGGADFDQHVAVTNLRVRKVADGDGIRCIEFLNDDGFHLGWTSTIQKLVVRAQGRGGGRAIRAAKCGINGHRQGRQGLARRGGDGAVEQAARLEMRVVAGFFQADDTACADILSGEAVFPIDNRMPGNGGRHGLDGPVW